MSRKIPTIWTALCLLAALLAGTASAAPVAKPDNLSKSIMGFFTEMEDMSAPVWLSPGVRVVYKISNEDFIDPAKDSSGYLIYDIVDVKADYVVSTLSTSQQKDGKPAGLMFGGILAEEPTVWRFWITPDLFVESNVPKDKYAIFYPTKVEVASEEHDAMILAFTSATAERTAAYDKETGLALLIEMVVSDSEKKPVQSTTIEYLGTRLAFPPWFGENVTGLSTGTQLNYKAVYINGGAAEEQTMDIKVLENNGGWALLERTNTEASGNKFTTQVVSSLSSGDVFLFWLPTGMLAGFVEGDVLFEEDLTGSAVKAMAIADDAVYGKVRKLLFIDNAVQTECAFSLKTGYMVSLHQKPMLEGIPEVMFTLTSVK